MTFLPITSDDDLSTAHVAWYELKEELVPWIGERAFTLFCYSISQANQCENDALSFRKILVDSGDDPENPEVTEAEQLLVDWGRLIVTSPHAIPEEFYARLEETFSPERRLALLSFSGQMLASNLLNTVGRIPLDLALEAYRVPSEN